MTKYGFHLILRIEVKFCSEGTNFTLSLPNGGIYMHPQILALALKLLLAPFIRGVMSHFRIAPSQQSGVAWRTVIEFEAFCALSAPDAYQREVFWDAYALKKTLQDARFFVPRSGCEKLIMNMVDNNHNMRDTVIRVSGPWEAELEKERGASPTTWNLGPVAQTCSVEIEAKLRRLAAINYDHRNWS